MSRNLRWFESLALALIPAMLASWGSTRITYDVRRDDSEWMPDGDDTNAPSPIWLPPHRSDVFIGEEDTEPLDA